MDKWLFVSISNHAGRLLPNMTNMYKYIEPKKTTKVRNGRGSHWASPAVSVFLECPAARLISDCLASLWLPLTTNLPTRHPSSQITPHTTSTTRPGAGIVSHLSHARRITTRLSLRTLVSFLCLLDSSFALLDQLMVRLILRSAVPRSILPSSLVFPLADR